MPKRTPASIAEYIATLTEYEDSVNQPKEVKGREALDTYIARSYNGINLLDSTRLPGADEKGDTFSTFLSRSAQAPMIAPTVDLIKNDISAVFTPSAARFNSIQVIINEVYTGIENELKANNMPARSMIALPKTIEMLKTDTLAEIDKIQKDEITALETYFNQPNTNPTLLQALPQATPDVIKKQLLEKLKENHKKQREEFEKTMDGSVKDLQKHFIQEVERINLAKYLSNTNEKMRKQIEEQNAQFLNLPHVRMQQQATDQFAGVDLDKLKNPTTVTAQGMSKGSTGYSVTLRGRPWFFDRASINPWDANFRLNDSEANFVDLMDLAARVAASGKDSICMTINSQDPDDPNVQNEIKELVKECIKACILKGFKPENITIKAMDKEGKLTVRCGEETKDGKEKKIPLSDAFAGDARLDKLLEQGEIIRKKRARAIDSGFTQQEYKDELNRLRQIGHAAPVAGAGVGGAPLPIGGGPAVPPVAHGHAVPPVAHGHAVPPVAHGHAVPPVAHGHAVPQPLPGQAAPAAAAAVPGNQQGAGTQPSTAASPSTYTSRR
jgi:hypothetical protein